MPRGVYERKPKGKYKLTVQMNGEVFNCTTDDIKSALIALNPDKFKSKVVITVANAYSQVQRVLMIQKARMLFRNDMMQNVFVKQALAGLKNA